MASNLNLSIGKSKSALSTPEKKDKYAIGISGIDSSNSIFNQYESQNRLYIPGSTPNIPELQTTSTTTTTTTEEPTTTTSTTTTTTTEEPTTTTSTTTTTTTLPPTNFISTWRTTTPNESITLPYSNTGTYTGTIDWGDSTTSANSFANRTHTYAVAGDYTVTIIGPTEGWSFGEYSDSTNAAKIRSISQWGNLFRLGGTYVQFFTCTNLDLSGVTDILNLSNQGSISGIFSLCTSLTTVGRMSEWNVSNISSMQDAFNRASSFNQDLSSWCVPLIPSLPQGFATLATAWTLPKPVWGTCPTTTTTTTTTSTTTTTTTI